MEIDEALEKYHKLLIVQQHGNVTAIYCIYTAEKIGFVVRDINGIRVYKGYENLVYSSKSAIADGICVLCELVEAYIATKLWRRT